MPNGAGPTNVHVILLDHCVNDECEHAAPGPEAPVWVIVEMYMPSTNQAGEMRFCSWDCLQTFIANYSPAG